MFISIDFGEATMPLLHIQLSPKANLQNEEYMIIVIVRTKQRLKVSISKMFKSAMFHLGYFYKTYLKY